MPIRIIDTSIKDCPLSHCKYSNLATGAMTMLLDDEDGDHRNEVPTPSGYEAGPVVEPSDTNNEGLSIGR